LQEGFSRRRKDLTIGVYADVVWVGEPSASTLTGSKALGESCSKTEECASSLCVRLDESGGICRSGCDDSGCRQSDNWGCVSSGAANVLGVRCVQLASTEVCGHHLDNDCNGKLPTDCGDRCTDTKVDGVNCGECGTTCGLGQSRVEDGPEHVTGLSIPHKFQALPLAWRPTSNPAA
jgi:hypothetical protein